MLDRAPIGYGRADQGSVFAILLLAVVLFAALIFVISRGMDTGTSRLTTAQARNMAADVIAYAQMVDRSVVHLLQNGVSEGDISFENSLVTGYAHTPAVTDSARVFGSSTGGTATWKIPLRGQTASGNKWLFTGGVVVTGQESNALSDLMMTLPIVTTDLCSEINHQLGVSIDLTSDQGTVTGTKFVGTYADNAAVAVSPGTGITAGCFKGLITDGAQSGEYTFFKVLIAR